MDLEGANPAFQPDTPHGMVIIDVLAEVFTFGVSPGCLRVVSGVGPRSPPGDISGGCLRAFWEHSENIMKAF